MSAEVALRSQLFVLLNLLEAGVQSVLLVTSPRMIPTVGTPGHTRFLTLKQIGLEVCLKGAITPIGKDGQTLGTCFLKYDGS